MLRPCQADVQIERELLNTLASLGDVLKKIGETIR